MMGSDEIPPTEGSHSDGWRPISASEFSGRVHGGAGGGDGGSAPPSPPPPPSAPSTHPLEARLSAAQAEGLEPNLRRQIEFLGDPGALELQVLGYRRAAPDSFDRARAAHAQSLTEAVQLCVEAERWLAHGVYVLPARLKPGVETRHHAPGKWYDLPKGGGTTDSDIAARLVIAIDFDVQRPSGTSATDEELGASIAVATSAWSYLTGALGDDAPMAYLHSGNGRQIHLALAELAPNEDTKLLLASLLVGLDALFSTDTVKVDKKLYDAKRILPACGTIKKKGAPNIADRPHRRTAIVTPETTRRLAYDDLRSLNNSIWTDLDDAGRDAMQVARGLPKTSATSNVHQLTPSADSPLAAYKRANEVDPREVAQWLGIIDGTNVPTCPGCGSTTGVAILRSGFKCHHNRCSSLGRKGFRTNIDLTMEVHRTGAREATALLAERFNFEGPRAPLPVDPKPAAPGAAPEWSELLRTVPVEWYLTPPPPRSWLLQDARRDNEGVLPLGKVGQIIAEGGAGKTMVLIQLAIALATGTPWLGSLTIANPGRTLLLLGEEDEEEVKRRLFQAACANGGGIPASDAIAVVPLAGVPCSMIEEDPRSRSLVDAPFLHWLRTRLASDSFQLVVVDPMSRFAGREAEKDNAAATRFIQGLESVAAVNGATVLFAHHTNQVSRAGSNGTPVVTATASRGVTALVDGARWQASLKIEQVDVDSGNGQTVSNEIATFAFTKSNYSRRADPIILRRGAYGTLLPIDQKSMALIELARSGEPDRNKKMAAREAEREQVLQSRQQSEAARRAEQKAIEAREESDRCTREDEVLDALLDGEDPPRTQRDIYARMRAALGTCSHPRADAAMARRKMRMCDDV